MSYARFGAAGSDVYVYLDVGQCLRCCGCILVGERAGAIDGKQFNSGQDPRLSTTAEMLNHLDEHRAAGHYVTESTYDALRADQGENDEWIRTGKDAALESKT